MLEASHLSGAAVSERLVAIKSLADVGELCGNLNGLSVNNQVMVDCTEANRQNFSSKIKASSGLKASSVSVAARKRLVREPQSANQTEDTFRE